MGGGKYCQTLSKRRRKGGTSRAPRQLVREGRRVRASPRQSQDWLKDSNRFRRAEEAS